MPQYKLTYFNLRAKGEVIRLLFAAAGVEYEDERIEHSDWPGDYKQSLNLPFGQLPILSIDGSVYCQSNSICRYLAEKYGLEGRTELEKLRCDMIVQCAEDVNAAVGIVRRTKDENLKKGLQEKFRQEKLDIYLQYFQKILEENHEGGGFYVGESMSWADLSVFHCLTSNLPAAGFELASFITNYPKLKDLLDRVGSAPRIAAWIAKRPVTSF